MSVHEIHQELFEDLHSINTKVNIYKKDFGRRVLKASRFPLTYSYDCLSRKKNLLVISFTVLKRSQWDNPILGFYGIYNRPDGKYAAALSLEVNKSIIYPPHFFRRYRERLVKDDSISNDGIIRLFFKKQWGIVQAVVDENFGAVYQCFESTNKDERVSFVSASSEGYCFGEKQGNINIMKTIISEEMLFEDQKPLFDELRTELNYLANKFFKLPT
ncbi:hypothetical protein G6M26_23370 [Agrobacterium tumefaciens]|nr:hypothetical protein [Agrobacterium tumefaciens]NTE21484.1 hypothetical protein [Agrobacterium tumefaciens]